MKPTYATNRHDLSGWYAYSKPRGRNVVWDGGANRSGIKTGLWCELNWQSIEADGAWLNKLPNTPLAGLLDEDGTFTVTAFPDTNILLPIVGETTDIPLISITDMNDQPATFYQYATLASDLIDTNEVCDFVPCRILPENKEEAYKQFQELPQGIAVHPNAYWVPDRSCYCVTNAKPPSIWQNARVREVKIQGGIIQNIDCWVNPGTVMSFVPMYDGDQHPDNKVFGIHDRITIYAVNNSVVGYEL